jgi:acyl-CoA thioesterase FadM/ketosteroid isomerase-like protein
LCEQAADAVDPRDRDKEVTARERGPGNGAEAVVGEFARRQREMYEGSPVEPLLELMAEDIVWHVPGTSPIAGDYRGRLAVLDYFQCRREMAGGRIAITKHAHACNADTVVQLADGEAVLGESPTHWRTAGVYRVADGRLAEVWLVPLDQRAFDQTWSRARPEPFSYSQRVRPQDCAAGGPLGHPRFLEFFEAAFIEWWRVRCGELQTSLGPNRRLTVAAVSVDYLAAVHCDEEVRTEVACDRVGRSSLRISYTAWVQDRQVARANSRYVCVTRRAGRPAPLPADMSITPEWLRPPR